MQKLKVGKGAIAGIIILLVLLILVRVLQERLFYDPFLEFYKGENYKGKALPTYDSLKLFVGLFFRYMLNSVLSLAIIWLFFRDRTVLKLSSILYAAFFVILIAAFFIVVNSAEPNLLILFYIRRFLIQPLFLILFIPAFYYQRKVK